MIVINREYNIIIEMGQLASCSIFFNMFKNIIIKKEYNYLYIILILYAKHKL